MAREVSDGSVGLGGCEMVGTVDDKCCGIGVSGRSRPAAAAAVMPFLR